MSHPNLLFIMCDEMREMAMSCSGDPNLKTPNLDRLAASGFRSTGTCTTSPVCCSARATMQTGYYPHNVGFPDYGNGHHLREDIPAFGEVLSAAGYATAHIGKWHLHGRELSPGNRYVPPNHHRGYGHWLGYEHGEYFFQSDHYGNDETPILPPEGEFFSEDWLIAARPIDLRARLREAGEPPFPGAYKIAHRLRVSVPLPPDEPRVVLKVIARDDEGLRGWDEVRIRREEVTPAGGDLHVLSVGVSRYRDSSLDLGYAAADAEAFSTVWEGAKGSLYRVVNATVLTDKEASTEAIRAALFKLVEDCSFADSVVLFLGGHGILVPTDDGQEYYFAAHEVDPANVAGAALPWTAFQTTPAKLDAKRVCLFLEACHSGSALGERQATNDRLAEVLLKEAGVMVFASSGGGQVSYELARFKRGAFTAAVLEGLGEGKADLEVGGRRDGRVTVEELLTYLRVRVPEMTDRRQMPSCPLMRDFGAPFPLVEVRPSRLPLPDCDSSSRPLGGHGALLRTEGNRHRRPGNAAPLLAP